MKRFTLWKKKGVLQLTLQLNFELQWPFTTHHISILWALLDKLQGLQLIVYTMQFI
jgi:hypothetical protein